MQLTEKIKIHPTEEQVDVLWTTSNLCRLTYNFALTERQEAWKNENRRIRYVEQQNKLPEIKEKFPQYKMVYSKVLQGVLKKLDANYKSFFALRKNGDTGARLPKHRGKNYFFTIVYNQSGFKFGDGNVSFSHKVNDFPLSFKIDRRFENRKVKQVEIYNSDPYKARGDWFISVTYDYEPEVQYHDNGLYQAVDAGITKIVTAVNSQGKFFEAKTARPDKYWNKKIDTLKSRRDHCKKNSRRWQRLNANIKKMERKRSNQNKDYQHKLSKKMVENTRANTIIVGDLKVKKMAKSKKLKGKRKKGLNRSTQNQGFLSRFIGFLTYKAERVGKKVIKIDESYTSKECYVCKKRHDMPLYQRTMSCDCGNVIDRDKNSAINIMERFLSQNALWTGYRFFADNLRQTGLMMGIEFLEPIPG